MQYERGPIKKMTAKYLSCKTREGSAAKSFWVLISMRINRPKRLNLSNYKHDFLANRPYPGAYRETEKGRMLSFFVKSLTNCPKRGGAKVRRPPPLYAIGHNVRGLYNYFR